MVETLLTHGANANVKLDGGNILFAAILLGNIKILKLLVEKGNANVNSADENGLTALYIAAMTRNIEMNEYLTEHGAVSGFINKNDFILLHPDNGNIVLQLALGDSLDQINSTNLCNFKSDYQAAHLILGDNITHHDI